MGKGNSPVSSFGPELLEALRRGSNGRCEYDFESYQVAFKFLSRINALRAAMRREKHPLWEAVLRAGVRINKKENPCRVIIEPRDAEFRSALAKLGQLEHDTTRSDAQSEAPVADYSTPTEDSADSFLKPLIEVEKK